MLLVSVVRRKHDSFEEICFVKSKSKHNISVVNLLRLNPIEILTKKMEKELRETLTAKNITDIDVVKDAQQYGCWESVEKSNSAVLMRAFTQ